jgi:hypothetical protein
MGCYPMGDEHMLKQEVMNIFFKIRVVKKLSSPLFLSHMLLISYA